MNKTGGVKLPNFVGPSNEGFLQSLILFTTNSVINYLHSVPKM